MADEKESDPSDHLFPEERLYLIDLGHYVKQDIFNRDICSMEPHGGDYIKAVAKLAMLLGYRDHWDRDFQKARLSFRKVYVERSRT